MSFVLLGFFCVFFFLRLRPVENSNNNHILVLQQIASGASARSIYLAIYLSVLLSFVRSFYPLVQKPRSTKRERLVVPERKPTENDDERMKADSPPNNSIQPKVKTSAPERFALLLIFNLEST